MEREGEGEEEGEGEGQRERGRGRFRERWWERGCVRVREKVRRKCTILLGLMGVGVGAGKTVVDALHYIYPYGYIHYQRYSHMK